MKQVLIRIFHPPQNLEADHSAGPSGPRLRSGAVISGNARSRDNKRLERLLDAAYPAHMSSNKSRAHKANDLLGEIPTEEWDDLLRELTGRWEQAFANRQSAAKREGNTTPPPAPPRVGTEFEFVRRSEASPVSSTGLVTIGDLIERYLSDSSSPFFNLRPGTKANYSQLSQRLKTSCGKMTLADTRIDDLYKLYDGWTLSGVPVGNSMMSTLRLQFTYGAANLKDENCERLSGALRRFKFKTPPGSDNTPLTFDDAGAIRAKARELKANSVSLMQAIQFDCGLKTKDLLGEWVAEHEKGESEIIIDGKKWLTGIVWQEIDDRFVLRHVASQHQKLITIDLKEFPMVIEELEIQYPGFLSDRSLLPATGPVIVSEETKLPWIDVKFRRFWRQIATAVGLSVHVRRVPNRKKKVKDDSEIKRTAETEVPAVRH